MIPSAEGMATEDRGDDGSAEVGLSVVRVFGTASGDHLREALARLVGDAMRLADDAASVDLRWSVV